MSEGDFLNAFEYRNSTSRSPRPAYRRRLFRFVRPYASGSS
jgi:hypothetical protein